MDQKLIAYGLLCLTSFFTLINPIGVMPVFMTMTADLQPKARSWTAQKAILTAFIALLFFAFSGNILFDFFGISVDSFRVVGGIIFFMMGHDMLQARLIRTKMDTESVKQYVTDISITPLAIPMICGPGAITNSIVLMQDAVTLTHKIILVSCIAIVLIVSLVVLLGASRIISFLGDTGNKILMRLMGLIVMVIAIEFFVSGITPIIRKMILVTP